MAGCQALGVKGGFDYKRVCRNLGGAILFYLGYAGGHVTASI